jgi:hypothetical protein
MRTRPVALTTICLQTPFEFFKRTRFALAVPRGENMIVPSLVIVVPSASGLVDSVFVSR